MSLVLSLSSGSQPWLRIGIVCTALKNTDAWVSPTTDSDIVDLGVNLSRRTFKRFPGDSGVCLG